MNVIKDTTQAVKPSIFDNHTFFNQSLPMAYWFYGVLVNFVLATILTTLEKFPTQSLTDAFVAVLIIATAFVWSVLNTIQVIRACKARNWDAWAGIAALLYAVGWTLSIPTFFGA